MTIIMNDRNKSILKIENISYVQRPVNGLYLTIGFNFKREIDIYFDNIIDLDCAYDKLKNTF